MKVSKIHIAPHGPQFSKIVLGFWRLADPPAIKKNEIEISVLERSAFHNGSMDHCMQHHLSPMAWSPFAGGKLFQEPKMRESPIFTTLCRKSVKNMTRQALINYC